MPAGGAKAVMKDVGFVPMRKPEEDKNRLRKIRGFKKARGKGRPAGGGRKGGPLKTFRAGGRK